MVSESSLDAESVLLKDTPDHLVDAGGCTPREDPAPDLFAYDGRGGGFEVGGGGEMF